MHSSPNKGETETQEFPMSTQGSESLGFNDGELEASLEEKK